MNNKNNDYNNEYKHEKMNGYGISERNVSELDLYNLPDAFASTSSLDLLGTIAEMKLPSARSLENIQKYGMEGNGASSTSLSEWYSILGENVPLSTSMTDLPSQNASTTSLSSNFNSSMDWSLNPLMPWDVKKSSSSQDNGSQHFSPTNNNNSLNSDPMSFNIHSNNNSGNNSGNNNNNSNTTPKNLKHSLSRELLQAAAAAVAHDEAKQEIAKILKQQFTEKMKEISLNNNLNTSLNTVQSDVNQKNSTVSFFLLLFNTIIIIIFFII